MHIEFTQADDSHVKGLAQLVNGAYRGDGSKVGWTTEADILDGQRTDVFSLKQMINREDSTILIAEDEDAEQLVGCVHLEKQGNDLHLGMLTVNPEYQNKKIGKMLLSEAEALAEFWECTNIVIEVITLRTELVSWYEKRGFKKTGETKPFPMNDPRFGIPKVDKLEFLVMKKKI